VRHVGFYHGGDVALSTRLCSRHLARGLSSPLWDNFIRTI
jgi:hypothetical protein